MVEFVFMRIKQGKVNGLLGKYYTWSGEQTPEKFDENNLKTVRVDSEINFVWWDKPDEKVPHEYFGVEWEGYIIVPVEGVYRFYVVSDDGSRVWLDGELIIDAWKDQAPTVYHSKPLNLTAGYHKLLYRFYNRHTFAVAQLGWIRPDGISEIVPSSNLATPTGTKVEIEGLKEGYKVEIWSGRKIAEGKAGKRGKASIDIRHLETPIDAYFRIYDEKGNLVLESPVIREIWGGDRFKIVKKGTS